MRKAEKDKCFVLWAALKCGNIWRWMKLRGKRGQIKWDRAIVWDFGKGTYTKIILMILRETDFKYFLRVNIL